MPWRRGPQGTRSCSAAWARCANSLAQHLANEPLVGVSGYEPEADCFAQRWVTHASNRSQRLAQSMILYEADQLIRPTSVEGEAQPVSAHGDHVFAWLKAFHAEVTLGHLPQVAPLWRQVLPEGSTPTGASIADRSARSACAG